MDSQNRPSGKYCSDCVLGGRASACGLQGGHGFSVPYGDMANGVMLVGDYLANEEKQGEKALIGNGGFLMGRAFSRKRWKASNFRIINTLQCHPGAVEDSRGRQLPHVGEAISHCAPYLDEEIERMQPRCIVALGPMAFERLTGLSSSNTMFRREFMESCHGYVHRDVGNRTWVVGTFHPDFILSGKQHLTDVLLWDVGKALKIAQEGFAYEHPVCLGDPNVWEWEAWVERCIAFLRSDLPRRQKVIAADIENPHKRKAFDDESEADEVEVSGIDVLVDRISFAFNGTEGVSVPWMMPFLVGIRRILDAAIEHGTLVFWNGNHDVPRISQALSMPIKRHAWEDSMDAWHVWYNHLPKGLGFASSCIPVNHAIPMWKHLAGSEEAKYSALDSIILHRNHFAIQAGIDRDGMRWVHDTMLLKLDPAYQRMHEAGMLKDEAVSLQLQMDLEGMMEGIKERMQVVVPERVRGPKKWTSGLAAAEKGLALLKRKGEARPEDQLEVVMGEKMMPTCTACGEHPVTKVHVTRKTVISATE